MADNQESSVDILFKEHSFEEIESVRDNLAVEIEKRTDLLKSIVKEKYCDIVETSDAIKSMKQNLGTLNEALWKLDSSISNYHTSIIDKPIHITSGSEIRYNESCNVISSKDCTDTICVDDEIRRLRSKLCSMWECLDCRNFRYFVRLYSESRKIINTLSNSDGSRDRINKNPELAKLVSMLSRSKTMLKNLIYHKVQSCEPSQVGIIADCDQDEELYRLSLDTVLEFLTIRFRADISDTSFQSQIKRHQPSSYFNTETNKVEQITDEANLTRSIYVQIPKLISPELDTFLYDVCRAVNTIAGFSLTRVSIVYSLRVTIERSLEVYAYLLESVANLKPEFKRRRALQLYFDLLYLRVLLNNSKNIDLIETWDPKITSLTNKYEIMLDSIELYMISTAIHANVVELSQSTARLRGLLVPHQHY